MSTKPHYSKRPPFPTLKESTDKGDKSDKPIPRKQHTCQPPPAGSTTGAASNSSPKSASSVTPSVPNALVDETTDDMLGTGLGQDILNLMEETEDEQPSYMGEFTSAAAMSMPDYERLIQRTVHVALEQQRAFTANAMRQVGSIHVSYNVIEYDLIKYLSEGGLKITYPEYASGTKVLNSLEQATLRDVCLAVARLNSLKLGLQDVVGCRHPGCTPDPVATQHKFYRNVCHKCMMFTTCDNCKPQLNEHLQTCNTLSKLWLQPGIQYARPIIHPDEVIVIHQREYKSIEWKSKADMETIRSTQALKREAYRQKHNKNKRQRTAATSSNK